MNERADEVVVSGPLAIPRSELRYRASRAGGPGGQHVNRASTRVELTWNVRRSPVLSEEQRARILDKLGNRIDGKGVLHLVEGGSRSQHRNREVVTERFRRLVAAALRVPKARKKTRPPPQAKAARLRAKKRRSEVKALRRRVEPHEE